MINNLGNIIFLVVLGVMCWLGFHFLVFRPADVRSEVRTLASDLEAGMKADQVRAKAAGLRLCKLDAQATHLTTPTEFGARNWVLHLHYDKVGRLDGIACRTAGSAKEPVANGPKEWGVRP